MNNHTTHTEKLDAMKLSVLLLIEDNENDVALTQRVIETVTDEIKVIVRTMGETALSYLKEGVSPPQIILLDLGLPGMDGIAFIQAMRQIANLKPIPIVILTGGAMDVARATAERVDEFLLKPITAREFRELLAKLGFEV